MKKPWIWVVLLLSLGVNVGILATIGVSRFKGPPKIERDIWDGPRRERPMRRELAPPVGRMADALGLEGETRDAFIALQEEFFHGMVEQRSDLESMRRELRTEVMADEPDEERIDELLTEVGEKHSELDHMFVKNILDSRALLGPEQQQRYLQMLRRMREAMGEGGGPGGPGERMGREGPRRRPDRRPPG